MSEVEIERITKLKSIKECKIFAKNARAREREDLAQAAEAKAIELGAAQHSASTDLERDVWKTIHAYEFAMTEARGKTYYGGRTRPMVERWGAAETVRRLVDRDESTPGFDALVNLGRPDLIRELTFEALVLKYQDEFDSKLVRRARDRLKNVLGKDID